jgi:hypothetical protein
MIKAGLQFSDCPTNGKSILLETILFPVAVRVAVISIIERYAAIGAHGAECFNQPIGSERFLRVDGGLLSAESDGQAAKFGVSGGAGRRE